MATLSTTLTLASTDATSDTLKVSAIDALTVTNPAINAARVSVATDAATNILTASGNSAITYVYIKNTNTDAGHILTLKIDDATAFSDLGAGEFAILPIKGGVGLECQASGAAVVAEYGYWTKG
tara:strand:+ start:350 stop:721 length:372 start_codon:yes stop_codon:yes gene_type:complete